MKIFAVPTENNGVGWYRVVQPLKWLGRKKLVHVRSTPWDGNLRPHEIPQDVWDEAGSWAEKGILYATTGKTQSQAAHIMGVADFYKLRLVIDLDDHLTAMNPDHPNYENIRDSSTAFWAQKCIERADMWVTTNEYLAKQFKSVNDNYYIHPNAVDFDLWSEGKPKKSKKVRIGWVGASGHNRDMKILEKPLDALKEKYGDKIEFVTLGQQPYNLDVDEHLGWAMVPDYPKKYREAGFDIVLAPMADSAYNRAKSNLRLIEASTQQVPIVASPVGPYKDYPCLHAKETSEWISQISRLVDDEKLREKIGKKCYNESKNKYEISITAMALFERLKKLRRRKKKAL